MKRIAAGRFRFPSSNASTSFVLRSIATRPCIAKVGEVLFCAATVLFLLADKAPYFVALHVFNRDVLDAFGEQPFAALSRSNQGLHDQTVMNASDAGSGADAGALADHAKGKQCAFIGQSFFGCRLDFVRFCVCLSASIAAKALEPISMFAGFLAIDPAIVACH